ncbi:Armadillo-like helical domain-containing protein 4 [Labeo rohita]|uniref:Armadillo-like helical domain-containing protein 4 n=1 Tax=Labeo rohita TaxID=84645 RepID=A0ABQ8LQ38_LABRO|nr:armadillo-like helical domain-containing protein 4 isoform X2 [Labeo rohita]KAI2652366.1 Armadillo-like helical domain-containing protein 4 [Labeo rohita]
MFTAATFQSLLLAAICLVSLAVPHGRALENPERPGDLQGEDKESASALLKDRSLNSDSFSLTLPNTSLSITAGEPNTTHTSAPDGPAEEETVSRATADGNEGETHDGQRNATAPSSGGSHVSLSVTTPPAGDLERSHTLQLNSSEEDRRLTPSALPSDSFSLSPLIGGTSGDSLVGFAGESGPSFSSRLLDAPDTWTEADRLRAEEVSVLPSSQDVSTEATMSSEDLPLIFEPFEDVTVPGASSELSVTMTPAAVTTGDAELEQMVSMDTDHTSSDVSLSRMLETSGAKEPITEPHPTAEHYGTTQRDDITQSSVTHQALTVSEVVHVPVSKPKTDTEYHESKEEPDEDEEDEEMDSDEEEEESEEDLTESTMAPHTRPPYSLIPPPPVWVQRNQGLVRSWVELIREKAGYVSGMLAPVGIGIAGALLLVGALYSIRVIHRKRRNSFKHQRRKPPREVRSGPDNAMLLADSSEDEF